MVYSLILWYSVTVNFPRAVVNHVQVHLWCVPCCGMPTPHWAVWDAEEGGFDPKETRVRKVRNHPGKEAAEKAEDEHDKGMSEGCG